MLRIPLPSAAHSGAYIPEVADLRFQACKKTKGQKGLRGLNYSLLGASLMSLKSLVSLISPRLSSRAVQSARIKKIRSYLK